MFPAFLTSHQAERTMTPAEQREVDRNTGELAASLAGLGRRVASPFRVRRRSPAAGLPHRRPGTSPAVVASACAVSCPGVRPAAPAGRCC
jgi:hypothetical protein